MPKARTGLDRVLYTVVSPRSLINLRKLVRMCGGISRALYMEHLLKFAWENQIIFPVDKPVYTPHAKVKKKPTPLESRE